MRIAPYGRIATRIPLGPSRVTTFKHVVGEGVSKSKVRKVSLPQVLRDVVTLNEIFTAIGDSRIILQLRLFAEKY